MVKFEKKTHSVLSVQEKRVFELEVERISRQYGIPQDFSIIIRMSPFFQSSGADIKIWNIKTKVTRVEIGLCKKLYNYFGIERSLKSFYHEMAHLVDFVINVAPDRYEARYPRGLKLDHSDRFKKICVALEGSMCKSMAGEKYKEVATDEYLHRITEENGGSWYKWEYKCPCGAGFQAKRKRKREFIDKKGRNGGPRWRCRHCGTTSEKWKEIKLG